MAHGVSFGGAVRCIGVASALGAPFPGCEAGPAALRERGLLDVLGRMGVATDWREVLPAGTGKLGPLLREVADTVENSILAGLRPLVIGGDHAIAAGTWRGVARGLGRVPGLIWLDAHLDAHTPATTPSGNPHGMPLAALLGLGDETMTGIPGPCLDPARVAVIGVRSYEPEESLHLASRGVRVYGAEEVAVRGLLEVFAEARARVNGSYWGISLDLDALDPVFAPGVSTPVSGGLSPDALLPLLAGLLHEPNFVALELAEYNPSRDQDGRTATFVIDLARVLAAA